jgi:hypothetical protein
MIERDIWIAASEMIKLYGEEAAVHGALRADALREQEDDKGYSVWKRIIAAIGELNGTQPSGTAH